MRGTQHLLVGASIGGALAYLGNTEISSAALIVGVSSFASLAPDLDTNGKLARRMTVSHTVVRQLIFILGACIAAYVSFFQDEMIWIGVGIFIGAIFLSRRFITPKSMNLLTAACLIGAGMYVSILWLIGLGLFCAVAALSAHRGITHSFVGLLFFSWIASSAESYYAVDGVFLAAVLGYISHLVLDMRLLPFNKRGVKWLYPVLKKEW
ncbi:metal-dependent hydrolase [Alkalihalobacillus sp. MEB130]|uniref:metal-dependent hydrolase n=1 Tax=Alkalihalobacillus sp. MEB130 TaxID=2976704 RepID=UPI0028DEBB86|nr:metal-dependent hydrolase [Alkalihalobacillus sp. MEB130]MDT8863048.1 metal-dependent hydrolase [Alkalihalobacillus sp. MEB130]